MARTVPSKAALRFLAESLRPSSTQKICTRCVNTPFRRSLYIYRPIPSDPNSGAFLAQAGLGSRTLPKTPPVQEPDFILDEDIPTRLVRVKNPNGGLAEANTLFSVLSELDRENQRVRLLAQQGDISIVEITTKAALQDELKSKAERVKDIAKKRRDSKPKQIELNWAIGSHDLELKMKQLHQFLDKGKRVEVLLASKKRQRKATPEEAQNVVSELQKLIAEIPGCGEVKPMEGQVGGQALFTIQKQG